MSTYIEYSRAMLLGSKLKLDKQSATTLAKKIATLLIEFYAGLSSKFNVDEHRHYSFTPRNLT